MKQANIQYKAIWMSLLIFISITLSLSIVHQGIATENENSRIEREREAAGKYGIVLVKIPPDFYKYRSHNLPSNEVSNYNHVSLSIRRLQDYGQDFGGMRLKCTSITTSKTYVRGVNPISNTELRFQVIDIGDDTWKDLTFRKVSNGGGIIEFAVCPGEFGIGMTFHHNRLKHYASGPGLKFNVRAGDIKVVSYD